MISFILAISILTQTTYSVEDLKNDYKDIFEIRVNHYGDQQINSVAVILPDSNHLLYDLVKHNASTLDYLIVNGSKLTATGYARMKMDIAEVEKMVDKHLFNDPTFEFLMQELVNNYLETKDLKLEGFNAPPKLEITKKELLSCGSKFFYADIIMNQMHYYICVGQNDHFGKYSFQKNPNYKHIALM